MSETEWRAVYERLKTAGFKVSYERVSYTPENPLWRATARRDGREWITLGKRLGEALQEVEKETKESVADWRAIIVNELTAATIPEDPGLRG